MTIGRGEARSPCLPLSLKGVSLEFFSAPSNGGENQGELSELVGERAQDGTRSLVPSRQASAKQTNEDWAEFISSSVTATMRRAAFP